MTAARQPFTASPIPSTTLQEHGEIRFLHPGYPAPTNALLALPRVDLVALASRTPPTTFGVHYQTALIACQIIADNAFATGRLTLDQAGQQLVDLPLDGILTEDTYYFFVGDSPNQYPVVASFQDWEFPHNRIPDSWPTPLPSEPKRRCGITNFSGPPEKAHLVPREEEAWFLRNDMGRYGPTMEGTIHNSVNILPLRGDIYACFDSRLLTILPKAFAPTPGSPQYIVHFCSNNDVAANYWPTYHHCLVQYLDQCSRPYLFARFAWTILFHVKQFVTSGITRHVVVRTRGMDGNVEYDKKVLDGAELIATYGGEGLRGSQGSGKMSRTYIMMEEGEDLLELAGEDWDMDDIWATGRRGEKRRRQYSSDGTVSGIGPHQPPAEVEGDLWDTPCYGI
ncbi:hypothetical protein BGZ60DRAFT_482824 [Tricladium varicosporioides]|nr:hypothetical protein BGZ60DRAFT_482824 [Hymenoscyphus varicosporioides]